VKIADADVDDAGAETGAIITRGGDAFGQPAQNGGGKFNAHHFVPI
jgi:hypothetical protein